MFLIFHYRISVLSVPWYGLFSLSSSLSSYAPLSSPLQIKMGTNFVAEKGTSEELQVATEDTIKSFMWIQT